MALLALLRVTMRQTWRQPALLFALLLQLVLIVALAFGLHITFEAGELTGMRFFTLTLEEPLFLLHSSLPPLAGLLLGLFMFLFIAGTGSLYTDYLIDPLLGIVLSRKRSRILFVLSRLCGIWITLLMDLLLFTGSLWLLLLWKTGGAVFHGLFIGMGIFFAQCVVISTFCSLLGLLTESATGVVIIALSLQFLLGNATGMLDVVRHPVWSVVTWVLPQSLALDRMAVGALWGGSLVLRPLVASCVQLCMCTAITAAIFRRRDL